jgi:hypothetical protein
MKVELRSFERNQPFPVHTNLYDSEVDKDSEKPGGYFSKNLYKQKVGGAANSYGESSDSGDSSGSEKNIQNRVKKQGDANYNGFCRT